jgi:hypothetical protein
LTFLLPARWPADPEVETALMAEFLGFDHIDARVRSLPAVEPFYDLLLPALGLVHKTHSNVDDRGEWSDAAPGAAYNVSEYAEEQQPGRAPRFLGIIEDRAMTPVATRIAFALASDADLVRWRERLTEMGAVNVEPSAGSEYPALFFEDPSGTKLELCARPARLTPQPERPQ